MGGAYKAGWREGEERGGASAETSRSVQLAAGATDRRSDLCISNTSPESMEQDCGVRRDAGYKIMKVER